MTPKTKASDYAASTLLFGLGFVALALTIVMNVSFGGNVALTEDGKLIRRGASVAMDCAGPILFLAGGILWRTSRKMVASVILLCGIAFQAYTIVNLIGFGASERSGAKSHREKVDAAAKGQADASVAVRKDTIDWLKKSTVETKGVDSRRVLLGEVTAQVDKLANAPAIDVKRELEPDAHATMMAKIFGISVDDFLRYEAIAFAVLLGSLKMICFTLAPMFWPMKHVVAVSTGEIVAPPKDKTRAPKPTTPAITDTTNVIQLPQPETMREMQTRMVKKFIEECTTPAPGARVPAEDLLGAFKRWCHVNKIEIRKVKQNGFGRICGDLGMARKADGRNTNYLNIRVTMPMSIAA